jgi:hypothetical protein
MGNNSPSNVFSRLFGHLCLRSVKLLKAVPIPNVLCIYNRSVYWIKLDNGLSSSTSPAIFVHWPRQGANLQTRGLGASPHASFAKFRYIPSSLPKSSEPVAESPVFNVQVQVGWWPEVVAMWAALSTHVLLESLFTHWTINIDFEFACGSCLTRLLVGKLQSCVLTWDDFFSFDIKQHPELDARNRHFTHNSDNATSTSMQTIAQQSGNLHPDTSKDDYYSSCTILRLAQCISPWRYGAQH